MSYRREEESTHLLSLSLHFLKLGNIATNSYDLWPIVDYSCLYLDILFRVSSFEYAFNLVLRVLWTKFIVSRYRRIPEVFLLMYLNQVLPEILSIHLRGFSTFSRRKTCLWDRKLWRMFEFYCRLILWILSINHNRNFIHSLISILCLIRGRCRVIGSLQKLAYFIF